MNKITSIGIIILISVVVLAFSSYAFTNYDGEVYGEHDHDHNHSEEEEHEHNHTEEEHEHNHTEEEHEHEHENHTE